MPAAQPRLPLLTLLLARRRDVDTLAGRRGPSARVFILIQLAEAQCDAGHNHDAVGNADAAIAIARNDGYRHRPGRRPAAAGQAAAALSDAEEALAIHAETGHQLGAARAHLVAGHVNAATGDDAAADRHRRRGHDLLIQIGAHPAVRTTAIL